MPFFFCRLNPPRPDFPQTMSDAERALMGRHAVHLRAEQDKGTVVLFGPVTDPKSPFGLAILECADQAAARAVTDNDPTVLSGQGFSYDVDPMPSAHLRKPIQ
jgi:uncharacterized protein YciI